MFKDKLSKIVNFVKDNVGLCVGVYLFVFLVMMMCGCWKISFFMLISALAWVVGTVAQWALGSDA